MNNQHLLDSFLETVLEPDKEIINYNGSDVIKSVTKDANGKMIRPYKYFTVAAPNKFYIKLENQYYRRSF